MRSLCLAAVLLTAATPVAAQGRLASSPVLRLEPDTDARIGGVEAACTGIGQTRSDPHWRTYPIRLEVSDAQNTYLADEEILVRSASGRELLHVSCAAPWVLLRLPAGAYHVEAAIPGAKAQPRGADFTVPATGQARVVLRFPDL